MSGVRCPGLGPLVGHTTDISSRIWIKAALSVEANPAEEEVSRRTIGIATIVKINGKKVEVPTAYYFRLRREYDRTGTITFGKETGLDKSRQVTALQPDTEYEARFATLIVDDPTPFEDSISSGALLKRLPEPETWIEDLLKLDEEQSVATFRTFPKVDRPARVDFSFIIGSCRYPGLLWQTKNSDEIFGPLREEVGRDRGTGKASFVLMVGDQIYADMLNRHVPIGLADTFAEFQERYHAAFGSRHMRRLLRSVPHYMILDDHEISDNWSQDRIKKIENRRLFNTAIQAYRSYQWIHGPDSYGQRLFYNFDFAGYPFFVLDTRTQRIMDDVPYTLDDNHMLGRPSLSEDEPGQIDLLLEWLEQAQNEVGDAPKFIVTSSVFVPSPITAREGREFKNLKQAVQAKEESDSWPAFPNTKRALLRKIVDKNIQNVVFLSGDIHCSNVAEITFNGPEPRHDALKAFSITSSAFYWPFPFADGEPSNFVHDSTKEDQKDTFVVESDITMDYVARNFTQENNFCRVNVDTTTHTITVVPFGADGEQIETGNWLNKGKKIRSELQLQPWT